LSPLSEPETSPDRKDIAKKDSKTSNLRESPLQISPIRLAEHEYSEVPNREDTAMLVNAADDRSVAGTPLEGRADERGNGKVYEATHPPSGNNTFSSTLLRPSFQNV